MEDASKKQGKEDAQTQKKPSFPKRLWEGSGLNAGMLVMMFKGALPPTIAIAIYQSSGFADKYSTLGYLVAVMSILSFAIMPRAKFVQTMFFNIIGISIGTCIALLSIYCSVQARAHTTPRPSAGPQSSSAGPSPGAAVAPYNSSASAVCAIWLFFNIYVSNTLRASRPQLQFPVIMYSIFANVASIYAPQFATMAQGISFAKRLLEAFLTGFAIASGVSFFVFPLTSRTVVFKTSAGYIGALRGALKAQSGYLESLENKDTFGVPQKAEKEASDDHQKRHGVHHQRKRIAPQPTPEAKALKVAVAALAELDGKINGDAAFAKREMAYGKFDASEISELIKLMRQILLPVIGLSSVADIFDRIAERRGWKTTTENDSDKPKRSLEVKDEEKTRWSEIMRTLHHPFEILTGATDQGLQHALYTLELEKRPKKERRLQTSEDTNGGSPDLEAKGDIVEPGDKGFADSLSAKIDQFHDQRKLTLDTWCRQQGMESKKGQSEDPLHRGSEIGMASTEDQRNQRQLYLILYVSLTVHSSSLSPKHAFLRF